MHERPSQSTGMYLRNLMSRDTKEMIGGAAKTVPAQLTRAASTGMPAIQLVTRPSAERGYRKLFLATVTQADKVADFEILRPPAVREIIPGSK